MKCKSDRGDKFFGTRRGKFGSWSGIIISCMRLDESSRYLPKGRCALPSAILPELSRVVRRRDEKLWSKESAHTENFERDKQRSQRCRNSCHQHSTRHAQHVEQRELAKVAPCLDTLL